MTIGDRLLDFRVVACGIFFVAVWNETRSLQRWTRRRPNITAIRNGELHPELIHSVVTGYQLWLVGRNNCSLLRPLRGRRAGRRLAVGHGWGQVSLLTIGERRAATFFILWTVRPSDLRCLCHFIKDDVGRCVQRLSD